MLRGQPVIAFEPEPPPELLSRSTTPGSSNPCPGGTPASSDLDSSQSGPGTRHWPISSDWNRAVKFPGPPKPVRRVNVTAPTRGRGSLVTTVRELMDGGVVNKHDVSG